MSQGQQWKPQPDEHEPVKYGDVFDVSGQLARKPIAPQDASIMQSAENQVLGYTRKGGTAAVMQSAAEDNERRGVVGHRSVTDIPRNQGVRVCEGTVGGHRVITEYIGGEVVGRYVEPGEVRMRSPASALDREAITVGEALEATARSAGDKPVGQSDAAAIQAAEIRATDHMQAVPGGVAASAQSAASLNERTVPDENKTKLADVVADATVKLPDDKPVTKRDAVGVIEAEIRNKPDAATHPGGVAATMAAAARFNQEKY